MNTSKSASVSIGLFNIAFATEEPLVNALHAITSKCTTRNTHEKCHDFAMTSLVACSPDDLNCQCTKVANIQDYCRDVCGTTDYVSDATRLFLDDTCKQALLRKREKDLEPPTIKTSDVLEGLALKQLLESNEIPKGLSTLVEDRIRPVINKLATELRTNKTKAIEKRHAYYTNGNNGIGKSLQLHLLKTQEDHSLAPSDDYSDDFANYQKYHSYREDFENAVENPPSRYRDQSLSRPKFGYDYKLSQTGSTPVFTQGIDNEDINQGKVFYNEQETPAFVTMYVDTTSATIEESRLPESTSTVSFEAHNNVISRIRNRLNINAVHHNTTTAGKSQKPPKPTNSATSTTSIAAKSFTSYHNGANMTKTSSGVAFLTFLVMVFIIV